MSHLNPIPLCHCIEWAVTRNIHHPWDTDEQRMGSPDALLPTAPPTWAFDVKDAIFEEVVEGLGTPTEDEELDVVVRPDPAP